MADLQRKRRAREWEVTPAHFRAAAVVVLGLVLAAGGLGWSLGRGWGRAEVAPGTAPATEQGLVDLLARVDARAVSGDGVDNLTFPDTLTGVAADPPVPVGAASAQDPAFVPAGQPGLMPFHLVVSVKPDDGAEVLRRHLSAGWTGRLVTEEPGAMLLVLDAGPDLEHARRALRRFESEQAASGGGLTARIRPASR